MILRLKQLFSSKCPRCYKGELFQNKWYHLLSGNKMVPKCAVCGQRTELEPAFYHGTGYVSYMLTVAISITTFCSYVLITGYGFKNKELLWWFPANVVLLILLQPWLIRFSRVVWLTYFYHDDDQYHQKKNVPVK